MDKRQELNNELLSLLRLRLPEIKEIVKGCPIPVIYQKDDGSPVTDLDLKLSKYFEELVQTHFPDYNFYSEENFSVWKFPLLSLDPLDGTKEYIEGNGEWAISIGLFLNSQFDGEGWIYNPSSGKVFDSPKLRSFISKSKYVGEVSRSEWKSGLFTDNESSKFSVRPVGSIAYKLGRLSQMESDFVVSLRAKNIWDIAGGTLLCQKAGLRFYSQGKEVTSVEPIYHAPLIWCHEELFPELSKIYF